MLGEEKVSEVKVHPKFDKFSKAVNLNIIFFDVLFPQVSKKN